MKVENLTKYTCDVCGKVAWEPTNESSPMQEIRLPMKYYDKTGRRQGLTNQRIDICSECFSVLESDLSKHYDMCFVAYRGVEIKRHPTEEGGADDEQRKAD